MYCAVSARDILLNYSWQIRDGGKDLENCAEDQADTGLATNIDDNVVIDSDTLTVIGLTLTPSTLTLNEGATTTYTAMLDTQPTGAVTMTITSDNTDVTPTPATLTFTTTNWNSAQSVTITAAIDTNLDDNIATLTHTASNSGYAGVSAYLSVTATDTDTPPTFADGAAIASQTYLVGAPITPLILPEASGGVSTLTFALTPKTSIPAGLTFDPVARTLTGTPTTANTATALTYTVTDSATTPVMASLTFTVTVNPALLAFNPGTSPALTYTYTAGTAIPPLTLPPASGGIDPLAYTLTPMESIPDGLTFDPVARTLTGTPTTTANTAIALTYTVTDSATTPVMASLTFTVTVNPALLAFNPGTSPALTYTYTAGTAIPPLTLPPASGGIDPLAYTLTPMESIPGGLTFDPVARTLTGIPTTANTATALTYTVTDSATTPVMASLTFTVTVNPALLAFNPGTSPALTYTYTAGTAITPLTLPPASGGIDPLAYTLTPMESIPGGLTFDPVARTLAGTPTTANTATALTYTVTDSATTPVMASLTFTVTVNPAPLAFNPGTSPALTYTYTAGTAIPPLTLPPASGGIDPLAYTLTPMESIPGGLTFDPVARTLTGTPTTANTATALTYTVTDSATTPVMASLTFTVMVNPALSVTATDTDTPPTFADGATIASHTYPVGTPITTLILPEASGGVSTLTYALNPKTSIPAGLIFDASTRMLSGTPTKSSLATTLAYTVTDSATPTPNTVALTFTVTVVQVIVDNGGEVSYSSGAIATTDVGDDNNDMRLMLPTDHTVTTVMVGVGTNTPTPGNPLPNGATYRGVGVDIEVDSALDEDTAATVCLSTADASEGQATLYHWTGTPAAWEKIGIDTNTQPGFVCGETATFSPFAVGFTTPAATTRLNEQILTRAAQAMTAGTLAAVAARVESAVDGGSGGGKPLAYQLDGQSSLRGLLEKNGKAMLEDTMNYERLLDGASFVLPLSATDNASAGNAGKTAVWGSSDFRNLADDEDDIDWDGQTRSAHLGIDKRLSKQALAGLALSWNDASFEYHDTANDPGRKGEYQYSIVTLNPYFGWSNASLKLWGTAGYGQGEIIIDQEGDEELSTDTTQLSLAGGFNHRLLGSPGRSLNIKGDVAQTKVAVDAQEDKFAEQDVESSRMRLLLSGERRRELASGGALTPSLEIGVRSDGGDGTTGTGVEVGGGLRYANPGGNVAVAGNVRTLLAGEYDELGADFSVQLSSQSGRGLSFSLHPVWGRTQSATDTLWNDGSNEITGGDAELRGSVDTEVGYGIAATILGTPGMLTPYTGMTVEHGTSRLRLGGRFADGNGLSMHLEGTQKNTADGASHTVLLRGEVSF